MVWAPWASVIFNESPEAAKCVLSQIFGGFNKTRASFKGAIYMKLGLLDSL